MSLKLAGSRLYAPGESGALFATSPLKKAAALLLGLILVVTGCLTSQRAPQSSVTPAPSMALPTTGASTPEATKVPSPYIQIPVPPDADLFDLAARLKLKGQMADRVVNPAPVSLSQGEKRTFWLFDLDKKRSFQVNAVLRRVTSRLYMWFQEDFQISQEEVEASSQKMEEIYSKLTAIFGTEAEPGLDNDPHLYIIHATMLPLVAGYFSEADQYPKAIHEFSNEAEVIYVSLDSLRPNTRSYFGVLAHELQHAIHWRADHSEAAWVNEGLSELAADLAGFPVGSPRAFYGHTDTQLNAWPDEPRESGPYYGASYLFMKYLMENYGGQSRLRDLIHEPADGIDGVERWLAKGGYPDRLEDVFANWVIANFQGKGKAPLAYVDLSGRVIDIQPIAREGERKGAVRPFAANYFDVRLDGDVRIEFQGESRAKIIPNEAFSGRFQWWSNRGDSIDTTLTREFDLAGLATATLRYHAWYDNEEDWDYTYVSVSSDGGKTWNVLQSEHTSSANPVGNNFGYGYTGKSGGATGPIWIQDQVDLSPFAGGKVLVRFELVTDGAVNNNGFALDDVSLPELRYFADFEKEDGGWQPRGFVRIDNVIPQQFLVQVLEIDGGLRQSRLSLDADLRGSIIIRGVGSTANRAILIVSALNRLSTQPAPYSLTVQRATQ